MIEAKIIESKLNTYFPETSLDRRWDYYARTLNDYINVITLLIESDPNEVKPFTGRIIEYIKSTGNEKYEEDGLIEKITSKFNTESGLRGDVGAMFYAEAGNLKRDIMQAPIKIF